MKKTIILIVAACYLVMTCGVVVNYHFCMNRLASTSLFSQQDDKCGRCGMEIHQSNGCCHDELQVIKMQDDQQQTLALTVELPPIDLKVTDPSEYIVGEIYRNDEQRHFHNHSPPLLSAQDSYLLNGVFRI